MKNKIALVSLCLSSLLYSCDREWTERLLTNPNAQYLLLYLSQPQIAKLETAFFVQNSSHLIQYVNIQYLTPLQIKELDVSAIIHLTPKQMSQLSEQQIQTGITPEKVSVLAQFQKLKYLSPTLMRAHHNQLVQNAYKKYCDPTQPNPENQTTPQQHMNPALHHNCPHAAPLHQCDNANVPRTTTNLYFRNKSQHYNPLPFSHHENHLPASSFSRFHSNNYPLTTTAASSHPHQPHHSFSPEDLVHSESQATAAIAVQNSLTPAQVAQTLWSTYILHNNNTKTRNMDKVVVKLELNARKTRIWLHNYSTTELNTLWDDYNNTVLSKTAPNNRLFSDLKLLVQTYKLQQQSKS